MSRIKKIIAAETLLDITREHKRPTKRLILSRVQSVADRITVDPHQNYGRVVRSWDSAGFAEFLSVCNDVLIEAGYV